MTFWLFGPLNTTKVWACYSSFNCFSNQSPVSAAVTEPAHLNFHHLLQMCGKEIRSWTPQQKTNLYKPQSGVLRHKPIGVCLIISFQTRFTVENPDTRVTADIIPGNVGFLWPYQWRETVRKSVSTGQQRHFNIYLTIVPSERWR